ncbi:MAG: YbjN domain-containing protein [Proteobacteria bacterium]|jgi:hypothetical protein|nr:YbjN domain-containing protein [Pseudomonadota bacterium]
MTDGNEFVDRETGRAFADARGLVDAFIARFSAKVSEARGAAIAFDPLDADGYTCLSRGSATIGINVLAEQGTLLFLSRVIKVPAEKREELYRFVLELNYTATSDAAFAIERDTDTVCLRAMRSLAGLDYDEFEDMLHSIAAVADEWDDELRERFS